MSTNTERRNWLRLDKVFPVLVESPSHGYINCIARNISQGGLFLETRAPLPLGTPLRIYFALPQNGSGISAQGQVKNHYYLNFASNQGPTAMTGMGVRFTQFDEDGENRLVSTLGQSKVFH